MKKILTYMLLCVALSFTACQDDLDCKDLNSPDVNVTGVSLNKTTLSLAEATKETLVATVSPEKATNKAVKWSSDKTDIATVSATGEVTAIKIGTATITVTTEDGGKTASCIVTVTSAPIQVIGIALDKAELSSGIGGKTTLIATVTPEDATNKNVKWTSSDEKIAVVSETGEVTAMAVGVATITATTEDGGKTATCLVTVSDKALYEFYGAKNMKLVYFDGTELKEVVGANYSDVASSVVMNNNFYAVNIYGQFFKNGELYSEVGKVPADATGYSAMCASGNTIYTVGVNNAGKSICWKNGEVMLALDVADAKIDRCCALNDDVFVSGNYQNVKKAFVYKNKEKIFEVDGVSIRGIQSYNGKVYMAVIDSKANKYYRYVYDGKTMIEEVSGKGAGFAYFKANEQVMFTGIRALTDEINFYKNLDWNKALPSIELPEQVNSYSVIEIAENKEDTYMYISTKNPVAQKVEMYYCKNFVNPMKMEADTITAIKHIYD